MYSRGFTLFELLITVAIVALLLTLGVPSFSAQIQKTKFHTIALSLFEAVQFTRTHAISTNKRTTLKHHGKWEDGWDIFLDVNNNGLKDDDETLVLTHDKVKDAKITANRPLQSYISFISSGESRYVGRANAGAFQAGTMKVCPLDTGRGYKLVLSRSGRMRMNEISAEECAAP